MVPTHLLVTLFMYGVPIAVMCIICCCVMQNGEAYTLELFEKEKDKEKQKRAQAGCPEVQKLTGDDSMACAMTLLYGACFNTAGCALCVEDGVAVCRCLFAVDGTRCDCTR